MERQNIREVLNSDFFSSHMKTIKGLNTTKNLLSVVITLAYG